MCCEWCGKTKNNKRKVITERNINKRKRETIAYKRNYFLFLAKIINIMDELRKTSTYDLINVWIDLARPTTQHISDGNSSKWHSSLRCNKCMENVEMVISEKLEITLLETKIMLNSKKKIVDLQKESCSKLEHEKQQIKQLRSI